MELGICSVSCLTCNSSSSKSSRFYCLVQFKPKRHTESSAFTYQTVWTSYNGHDTLPPILLAFPALLHFRCLCAEFGRIPRRHIPGIAILFESYYVNHAIFHPCARWYANRRTRVEDLSLIDYKPYRVNRKPFGICSRKHLRPKYRGCLSWIRRALTC